MKMRARATFATDNVRGRSQPNRWRRWAASPRRGFTLLEVVLALGLASLLLAALYTALQMHWSSSALGQVEMERSQVARALFRRIETDLRSVVFRDAPLSTTTDDSSTSASGGTSSGSTNSGTSSGSSTSSTTPTVSTDSTTTTTENYSTQKSGLFGDAESLVVHISLPKRSDNFVVSGDQVSLSGSDLQSVVYFMSGGGSALAQKLPAPAPSSTGATTGLARMQGDRMAMQAADQTGDFSALAANVKLLAPEVASIGFEYFDGVSWGTTWDSAVSNSIPNAVRITIVFRPPESANGWYTRPVSVSTDRFQHVVALPLAKPLVTDDAL
jgi:prepilin-type N-terminal cleavage/methylation domain-containing protein